MSSDQFHDQRTHVRKVLVISTSLIIAVASGIIKYVPLSTTAGHAFAALFALRYVRFVVNTVSWYLAKPYVKPINPTLTPKDVTVIIPSANPDGGEFLSTVESALNSGAAKVIVVTFGEINMAKARRTCASLLEDEGLAVVDNKISGKRRQMITGVNLSSTGITVFMDDHVFWPEGFLPSILAPFEDKHIGGVGTHKQVLRKRTSSWKHNLVNFLGCIYLDRHNAEILATNRLDGGVFIISSRTAAYRTSILKDQAFQDGFLNEYVNFPIHGRRGPLQADDDNFIMRWLVTHDKKIWIQNGPEALMKTTINDPSKFVQQLLRWVRTTWRSNPTSIMEGKVMRKQPWSFWATNLSLCINFAAIMDPVLIWTLHRATSGRSDHLAIIVAMVLWILFSKLVKLLPFFMRNPRDIYLFPVYVAFAYCHSFLKMWALLTAHDIGWGSRSNVDDKPTA